MGGLQVKFGIEALQEYDIVRFTPNDLNARHPVIMNVLLLMSRESFPIGVENRIEDNDIEGGGYLI